MYDQFQHTVQTCCKACDITNQMKLPSIILLGACLNYHKIGSTCIICTVGKVKREGTILYWNNGDFMRALSHSLAKNCALSHYTFL